MADITVVRPGPSGASIGGASSTSASGDTFTNDGKTILRFTNTNGSARNVTIAPKVTATVPYGSYKTYTINVPATSGDVVAGPFEPSIYNDPATNKVSMTYDAVTNLSVYAISCGA